MEWGQPAVLDLALLAAFLVLGGALGIAERCLLAQGRFNRGQAWRVRAAPVVSGAYGLHLPLDRNS